MVVSGEECGIKKFAIVAIVGRPSSGKSSLMNILCGDKISIVTPIPQTTRNSIRGIINNDHGQIVCIDTPGIHLSKKQLNKKLRNISVKTLASCNIILYVVDITRPPGAEEENILSLLSLLKQPLITAYNKIDICSQPNKKHRTVIQSALGMPSSSDDLCIPQRRKYCEVYTSALTGEGIINLRTMLFEFSPESEIVYPTHWNTDQEPAFRIAEVIREQAMFCAYKELPYAIMVKVQDMEYIHDGSLFVRANIFVETKSQIGIIVGNKGKNIRSIRKASQREIGKIFACHVHIDLQVKKKAHWHNNFIET